MDGRKLVDRTDTTHRQTDRPIVVVARIHVGTVEDQAVPTAGIEWRCTPIVTVSSNSVEAAIAAVATARSRER